MSKDKLAEYRKKRDFERSPEPGGSSGGSGAKNPIFVIQKHDASSTHFDFRLEVDDVLKSWAVPKGPSTDPREKRLAVRTEDHPLDYADFEGVIPEGEYGGGTVMVWDIGPYRNAKSPDDDGKDPPSVEKQLEDGHATVWLGGERIKGGYALIQTSRRSGDGKQWLLVKMKDDEADARLNPVSTEKRSVRTNRTMREIRSDEEPTSFEENED